MNEFFNEYTSMSCIKYIRGVVPQILRQTTYQMDIYIYILYRIQKVLRPRTNEK